MTNADKLTEFISEVALQARVSELGKQISADYAEKNLLVIGILKGSFIFMADLVRAITQPVELSFITLSSYHNASKSSGEVRLSCDVDMSIRGRDVLIVEDIVDSGNTMSYLLKVLQIREPTSLKVCTLLDKPSRRQTPVSVEYCGFQVPDEFIVGYGLDYAGKYRNLRNISAIKLN
ncbi:hypoxanthine phosphoribosyltransferase [Deferribacterales bacterium RsTz2092]|nr:hypoxanthine phosphoribosyltransferase [Deferribacterales bacterium]